VVTAAARDLVRLVVLARAGWSRFAAAVVLGFLAVGSGIGLMAVAAWLIARASQHPPILGLEVAVVAVRALSLTKGLARYAERLVGHDAALRVLADLRGRLVEKLEPLAPGGLAAFRDGDLLSRLVADVDAVQDLYLRVLLPPAVAVLAGGLAVAVVGWLLPAAGLVLLAALLASGVGIPALTGTLGRRSGSRLAAAKGRLGAEVVEVLGGSRELVAYGAMDLALTGIEGTSRRLRELERSAARVNALGAGLALAVQGLCVVGVLALAVDAVQAGRLPTVALAVVVLTALAAFDAVAPLPAAAQEIGRVLAAGRRVLEVLDSSPTVPEPADPLPLPAGARGALQVHDLGVTYPGRDRPALRAVDLDLRPGRRVAVVGESGAGKSTLVAALLRFVAVDEGRVELGGTDLARFASDDVRSVLGACLQDGYVFDSTLRENLLLANRSAGEAELLAVLAKVGLAAWAQGLPQGLDTAVGRNGALMSGGQRQRLSLARALLADRPVLLLDEPTAGVDPSAARALMVDMVAAADDRAVLVVTHQLAGLAEVDEIVVLHDGRVAERGTPAQLLAGSGPFRALWDAEYGDLPVRG
jgi:thiol reductant ABC exporter CydC subunit